MSETQRKEEEKQPVQYVTTAIVYPNSRIHVGWAWECLGADWLVRSLKAFGHQTYFATGMDEHSVKVQRAAESKGLDPKEYCDQMAADIEPVLKGIRVNYDRFIRTTDEDHTRVVELLIKRAFDRGDIYKATYDGLYCDGCEAFYTEKDLNEGLCPSHATKPSRIQEENYFFRLSKYQDQLLAHFRAHPEFLVPDSRRSEVLNFIESGLKDFSISRSNFTFGIPLPFDNKQVIYVWFDALINYLTAAGIEPYLNDPSSPEAKAFLERWPARVHIIGKDISRFHCVYWPAMLMSLQLPLPRQVFAHGYITVKGDKMSKSLGNFVTPDEVVEFSGVDPFRYYLLAENQFSQDGSFAWDKLILKNNADLSNEWGNLVNRTISMTRKYFGEETLSVSETTEVSKEVRAQFEALPKELQKAVDEVDPTAFAQSCRDRGRLLNLFIDQTKPWKLAKEESSESKDKLKEVLTTLLEGIRWLALCWEPLLCEGMPKVFSQLGLEYPGEFESIKNLKWGQVTYSPVTPSPIYPRLEMTELERHLEKPH